MTNEIISDRERLMAEIARRRNPDYPSDQEREKLTKQIEKVEIDIQKLATSYNYVNRELKWRGISSQNETLPEEGKLEIILGPYLEREADLVFCMDFKYGRGDPEQFKRKIRREIFNPENIAYEIKKIKEAFSEREKILNQFADKENKKIQLEGRLATPAVRLGTLGELQYLELANKIIEDNIMPSVYKGRVAPANRFGYSLGMNGGTLFQIEPNGGFTYIFTSNSSTPFKLQMTRTEPTYLRDGTNFVNAGMCDFVTSEGIKLFGQARDIADNIFTKVRTGKEILPPKRIDQIVYEQPSKNDNPIGPRHWGQSYLQRANPTQTINGELFASGHSFAAYRFGDKIIVESDKENDATYLLDAARFEELRVMSRDEILKSKPNGFYGRVYHLGNTEEERQKWRNQVDGFLALS